MSEPKVYARIEDKIVVEMIWPYIDDGYEWPIELRFPPEFVATLVDVTEIEPKPAASWTYDGSVFAAPVPYQPSPDEIAAANEVRRQDLLASAASEMSEIMLTLQLGDGTDQDTVNAKAWREYYRALKLVDITIAEPAWPVAPE